jgi:hypothetical protein
MCLGYVQLKLCTLVIRFTSVFDGQLYPFGF